MPDSALHALPARYFASARLGEERQLPRRSLPPALVGQRGRIVTGEAVVGELRAQRIALLVAHRAVDAFDRQEGQRIRPDETAHAFEVVRPRQWLVALRRVDAVIVGMGDRRGGRAGE